MTELLPPHQLGFGVSQGAECAVHAARFFANNLGPHQALVKVDFRNAFNCVRRDKVMAAIEEFLPSLLPFIHSAHSSSLKLFWEDAEVISAEGVQQGDTIGPLLFCITIHKMVLQMQTAFNVWYLDDGTLGGGEEECPKDHSTRRSTTWPSHKCTQVQTNLPQSVNHGICSEFLSRSEDCGSILWESSWAHHLAMLLPCIRALSPRLIS